MAEESHSLRSLQELHADLLALSESRLSNIERLGLQLEGHIEAFKALLDKKLRSEQSRKTVIAGKGPSQESLEKKLTNGLLGIIPIHGQSCDCNDKFKEDTLEVADDLDLDEILAATIFHDVQSESEASGRSGITCSIIHFHQRRKELLDCLRLTLQIHADVDNEEIDRDILQQLVDQITQPQNSIRFISRCLSSMKEIKAWVGRLSEKSEKLEVVGQGQDIEDTERLEYQRVSLMKQHESLSGIVFYLAKIHAHMGDLEGILQVFRSLDKYDHFLRKHYYDLYPYIQD